MNKVNLAEKLARIDEIYKPKLVATCSLPRSRNCAIARRSRLLYFAASNMTSDTTSDGQDRPGAQGQPAWDEDALLDHHLEEVLGALSALPPVSSDADD